ncbi:MAG: hypothetical protein AAF824_07060 [Bacteroidota bacterium]
MNKQSFSFNRLWLLTKREIILKRKPFLITAAVISIAFILSYLSNINEGLINNSENSTNYFHQTFFQLFLGIGGAIVSGKFFADQLLKDKGHVYLLLPATTLEKYISGVLITGIGYTLFSLILYAILSTVADAITLAFVGKQLFVPFSPFSRLAWNAFRIYLSLNALFLLGGLIYHKNPVIKTIASGFGVFVGFMFLMGLTMKIVFWEYIDWGNADIPEPNEAFKQRMEDFFDGDLADIGLLIGPVFLWITGFFRLKEQEA